LWDAQLVPLVRAAAAQQQAKVTSYEIDCQSSSGRHEKTQEEGIPQWSQKAIVSIESFVV
jgi:hypothetical protein